MPEIQPLPPPRRLRDRSTGDLLVMMVGMTIAFVVVGTTVALWIIEIRNPDSDTSSAAMGISDVINTLIGLLAGFLAGRSDTALTVQKTERRVRDEQEGSVRPVEPPE